jgi:hypothetical protein
VASGRNGCLYGLSTGRIKSIPGALQCHEHWHSCVLPFVGGILFCANDSMKPYKSQAFRNVYDGSTEPISEHC